MRCFRAAKSGRGAHCSDQTENQPDGAHAPTPLSEIHVVIPDMRLAAILPFRGASGSVGLANYHLRNWRAH
jgi:hypothetical protein